MFILKPHMRVVATILAKNEEDIIGFNIEHHISQGITHFIITDNNSTDNTRKICEKYPEVVEIIDESGDDHRQSDWVSRMARLACKLDPDWIIHLDADELWCGISQLRHLNASYVASTKMFLHPPCCGDFSIENMRYYLDFENIPEIPGECKVAHRPDPEIVISHGNHGFEGQKEMQFTKGIWRHHYPVRSYNQFVRKSLGHQALLKRNAICNRWKKWYDELQSGHLEQIYTNICQVWHSMVENPNQQDLLTLLEFWSTEEVIEFFKTRGALPQIGEWPRRDYAKQGNIDQRQL